MPSILAIAAAVIVASLHVLEQLLVVRPEHEHRVLDGALHLQLFERLCDVFARHVAPLHEPPAQLVARVDPLGQRPVGGHVPEGDRPIVAAGRQR